MNRRVTLRFWTETVCSAVTALSAVLTLLWKDWIELVFRVDPDHHSGSLEWQLVAAAAAVSVATAVLARRDWRRAAVA
ncbi:MAG TPA: hypothetical protein VGO92_02400 [Acidimicrobiales bacterium]|jgi:hypothetical protein|nr:hypothetical protein [Acidimicrobiales bacterium]